MHEMPEINKPSIDTPFDKVTALSPERYTDDETALLARLAEEIEALGHDPHHVVVVGHGPTDPSKLQRSFGMTLEDYARTLDEGGRDTPLIYAEYAEYGTIEDTPESETDHIGDAEKPDDGPDEWDDGSYDPTADPYEQDITYEDDDPYEDSDRPEGGYRRNSLSFISVLDPSRLNPATENHFEALPGQTIDDARIHTFNVTEWIAKPY